MKKTCLVVDDSGVVRKVVSRIMVEFGFSCFEAKDGQEAYDFCTQNEKMPECILLDWNMPVMNGLDFLKKLRKAKNGNNPIVILCTTENDMKHIITAMKAGANEYIMKPFDADIIKSKLIQCELIEDDMG